MPYDKQTEEQLWNDPNWTCPRCKFVNLAIREVCRNCGFDSALVSGDSYFPVAEPASTPGNAEARSTRHVAGECNDPRCPICYEQEEERELAQEARDKGYDSKDDYRK